MTAWPGFEPRARLATPPRGIYFFTVIFDRLGSVRARPGRRCTRARVRVLSRPACTCTLRMACEVRAPVQLCHCACMPYTSCVACLLPELQSRLTSAIIVCVILAGFFAFPYVKRTIRVSLRVMSVALGDCDFVRKSACFEREMRNPEKNSGLAGAAPHGRRGQLLAV